MLNAEVRKSFRVTPEAGVFFLAVQLYRSSAIGSATRAASARHSL
jgi:hypothetical protein